MSNNMMSNNNSLCEAAFPLTAGEQSPAVFFFDEREGRKTLETLLAEARRALIDSREREVAARNRADVLELCLATQHEEYRILKGLASLLLVGLVVALFALLA